MPLAHFLKLKVVCFRYLFRMHIIFRNNFGVNNQLILLQKKLRKYENRK